MFEKLIQIFRANIFAGVLIIIGLILTGIGLTQLDINQTDQNTNKNSKISQSTSIGSVSSEKPSPSSSPLPTTNSHTQTIIVDVQGAVIQPGTHALHSPARISDALKSAGDLALHADVLWVSRNLNRAQTLQDGDKIYVPKRGEVKNLTYESTPQPKPSVIQIGYLPAPSPTLLLNNTDISQKATSPQTKVSINTASAAELDSLEGIGETRAKKIIENRPYNTIEDLITKKIIYKSTYEKIKDDITL